MDNNSGKLDMFKSFLNSNEFIDIAYEFSELSVCEVGKEQCMPNKFCAPNKRQHFVVHYIENGRGTYIIENREYNLKAGDLFLIPPNKTVSYFPDKNHPWAYSWIGYTGIKAERILSVAGLSSNNPIKTMDKTSNISFLLNELISQYYKRGNFDFRCLAIGMEVLAEIIDANKKNNIYLTTKQGHVKEVLMFIHYNYNRDITIDEVARSLNLNVNYLRNVFTEVVGISPKKYLFQHRMNKAKGLLKDSDSKIKDICIWVGYVDQLKFSKDFHKYVGVSPTAYRENNIL